MIGQKLFVALQKLSPDDWGAFTSYLESPLLGNSPLYARMLKHLQACLKAKKAVSLNGLHAEIYPIGSFPSYYVVSVDGTVDLADGRIGHLKRHFSGLLDKLYEFWGFQQYQQDTQAQRAYKMAGLARSGELDAFEKAWEKSQVDPSSIPVEVPNASRLLDQAVQAMLLSELQADQLRNKPGNRFQAVIDRLDEGYLLAALDLACKAYNHDIRYWREGMRQHTQPRFLDLARTDSEIGKNGLAGLLIALYRMYHDETDKDAHFRHAQSQFFSILQGQTGRPSLMHADVMNHLINFAGRAALSRPGTYQEDLQTLYDFALRNGVYLQGGELSPQHFQNIVRVFLKINSLDWVAHFLTSYKHQLPAPLREVVFEFNWGLLEFRRGNFTAARHAFLTVESTLHPADNLELSLQLRAMLIAVEYELGNWGRVHSRAQAFLAWLKGVEGVSHKRVSAYLHLARLTKKMARLRMDYVMESAQRKWEKMRQALQPDLVKSMILGDWIMDQLFPKGK